MPALVRDYLALPEVVFLREHWVALLVFVLVAFVLAWNMQRR